MEESKYSLPTHSACACGRKTPTNHWSEIGAVTTKHDIRIDRVIQSSSFVVGRVQRERRSTAVVLNCIETKLTTIHHTFCDPSDRLSAKTSPSQDSQSNNAALSARATSNKSFAALDTCVSNIASKSKWRKKYTLESLNTKCIWVKVSDLIIFAQLRWRTEWSLRTNVTANGSQKQTHASVGIAVETNDVHPFSDIYRSPASLKCLQRSLPFEVVSWLHSSYPPPPPHLFLVHLLLPCGIFPWKL